ncbi:MAG TPA: pentapeptide repeat-containing protein [Leptolyngbyaceae cyanobacterium]
MATPLWKFLTTDIKDLVTLDTANSAADAVDAVMGLATTLKEEGPKVQQLAPLVGQLNPLLDVLNSPMGKLLGASLPFVSIGTGLLQFYLEKTQQEPTLAQTVALISQAAYLESFKEFVQSQSPTFRQRLETADRSRRDASPLPELKALGEFELSDKEARLATLYFHDSSLAQAYNDVLAARLRQLGANAKSIEIVVEQVSRGTDRHIRTALADAGESAKRLVEWYRIGGDAVFEKYASIDTYLSEQIATRPTEQVFAEAFTFRDIYVPLKAQPLTASGNPDEQKDPVVLEQWARDCLNDETKKDRVMFIQAGPGRGKSVFCRMFADWVRQHEHPRWTPILIRLRDVSVLEKDFEETLTKAVGANFAKADSGWLSDRNLRFLFLLDGFDELLMEGRTTGGLNRFLDQVGRFQAQCARNSEKGHRVLITGRTLCLQSIERSLPNNLERMEILAMDDDLQNQWFEKWSRLVSAETDYLISLLRDQRLPERVQQLAREPLLLYMLAAMHRDGELSIEMFEESDGAKAKVLIYEKTLEWVLTKQRPDWLNEDLTEIEIQGLRRILMEAGLCVVQSGMEFAAISTIESRLQEDQTAKSILEEARKRLEDSPLRNALAAFYMQSGRKGEGSVEFIHKSFGEFLCAERIVYSLIDWCQPGRNREFDIPEPEFCWGVYDLLGCHVLTPEIVEYLTALLTKHEEFQAVPLFKRLNSFYLRWCSGEFIDAPPENLPQQKMRRLREQMIAGEEVLGQRQVDLYAGLNVMILLFELHRYGQTVLAETAIDLAGNGSLENPLAFHPCGQPNTEKFDKFCLLNTIGYSQCLRLTAFLNLVGAFLGSADISGADLRNVNFFRAHLFNANLKDANLRSANLSSANLNHAHLSGANLSSAYLNNAFLRNANLRGTNLSRAHLSNAYLSNANLSSANLRSADLRSANLRSADLRSTDLRDADLRSTNLRSADLCNVDLSRADLTEAVLSDENGAIQWDDRTVWEGVKGLDQAIGVPDALKQQLGLDLQRFALE